MSKDTQLKVLSLELEQQSIIAQNLSKKIGRYERANSIVKNTIAQQEIDDLKTELKTAQLQKEILSSKIESLQD
jgi:multidrug resistance efflux pump